MSKEQRGVTKRKDIKKRVCINCGEEGPHFVPPCFGDPGFFHCKSKGESK